MKIHSYYLEMKNRLVLLILGWSSTILVSYTFKETLLFIFTKQNTYSTSYPKEVFYFIFTDVTEIFSVYITLIFFIGNQILILYLCYHILIFIALGLYRSEYNYLVFVFKTCLFLFLFSVVVFNKVLFSFTWDFFLSFQHFVTLNSLTLHFEAKLSEYLNFYIVFYYVCIFYFQTFLFLILFFDYFKNELGIIKRFRKFFYYFFVIFSTLVTPPDVFSQIILSFSIILSYEMLVFYLILKKSLIR